MNDENKPKEPVKVELPPQKSATDTSNWDNKISTDPNGVKYIRADIDKAQGC